MRLRIINAVARPDEGDGGELLPYLRPFLREDTRLEHDRVKFGFPSIECDLHGMVNGAEVAPLIQKAEQEGANGVFVNCFDDPGVYAARELVKIPVFGAYQPAILTAMGLADRIGIITTDRAGILSEERKARLNGFDRRVADIRAVDMGVLSLEANLDVLIDRLCAACVDMYEHSLIGALTLGCTGMHNAIGPLRARLKELGCPITIIEPLQNGISYLESTVVQRYSNALGVIGDINAWHKR